MKDLSGKKSKKTLLVIDMQEDFIKDTHKVIPNVARLVDLFISKERDCSMDLRQILLLKANCPNWKSVWLDVVSKRIKTFNSNFDKIK